MCKTKRRNSRTFFALLERCLSFSRASRPGVRRYEGHGGDVSHAVDFVLQNFSETNRLWVRMQNQGPSKERKRRSKAASARGEWSLLTCGRDFGNDKSSKVRVARGFPEDA